MRPRTPPNGGAGRHTGLTQKVWEALEHRPLTFAELIMKLGLDTPKDKTAVRYSIQRLHEQDRIRSTPITYTARPNI